MSSLPDIERIAQGASNLAYAVPEPTQAVPELLAARQSVQHSVDGMFKCIPFNGNAAFWQNLALGLNLRVCVCVFVCVSSIAIFYPWNTLYNDAPASSVRKVNFQFFTYVNSPQKNRQLDFHTIYRNWPPAYTLYICQTIFKLNEFIKLILASKRQPLFLHAKTCR